MTGCYSGVWGRVVFSVRGRLVKTLTHSTACSTSRHRRLMAPSRCPCMTSTRSTPGSVSSPSSRSVPPTGSDVSGDRRRDVWKVGRVCTGLSQLESIFNLFIYLFYIHTYIHTYIFLAAIIHVIIFLLIYIYIYFFILFIYVSSIYVFFFWCVFVFSDFNVCKVPQTI